MSKEVASLQNQIHKLQEKYEKELAEKDAKINSLEEIIANKNQIICNFHHSI